MKSNINLIIGKKVTILLILVIFLAAFLRIYKLDSIPPALNWDEIDAGYNAYTIANWARDEWGQFLPLVFTSFRDDKHPIHIYLTVPLVKIFGLSDFTARLPGALVGTLSVVIVFYLARILFKSDLTALFSALFLAISPYHMHFSRGLWEIDFALFFLMLGLLLFYMGLQKKNGLVILSYLSFGFSILSYHSSKIIVPSIVFILTIFYFKDLKKLSINFYIALLIFLVFIILLITDPRLLGFARAKQTQFSKEIIEKTQLFQKTKNPTLGLAEIAFNQYLTHFTTEYLFIKGDQGPRNSVKTFGQFYKIDVLFLLVGLFYLLKMRSRVTLVILSWLLLSPIPSSLVVGAPNATRALFMMGSLHLIAALGAGQFIKWFRGKIKYPVLVIVLILLSIEAYSYVNYYFNIYPKKAAIDWQYGMKQIVEYVKSHPEYTQVYMTNIRSQPYIFFLFYLKTPLPEFLDTVVYNQNESKSFSTVAYFDKYYFEDWDPIESMPYPGVLYVVSPSQYDGMRHKADFDVKKQVLYPDGSSAFFIVSSK